jgi:hypothetical protein
VLAALLRWTDCCALLQGQVNCDADWQLGCWGQKVKELCVYESLQKRIKRLFAANKEDSPGPTGPGVIIGMASMACCPNYP